MSGRDDMKQDVQALLYRARAESKHFDANAFIRGAQLTIVGSLRALHNPNLFRSEVYRQARWAVGAGLVIKILVEAPVFALRMLVHILPFIVAVDKTWWDANVVDGLNFFNKTILQLPYVLMSLLQIFMIGPNLDDMFMTSLEWVDLTYSVKHKTDDPSTLRNMFYQNLKAYPINGADTREKWLNSHSARKFIAKFGTQTATSLVAYLLSYLPIIGRFALPMLSFFTFKKAVGSVPAGAIFGIGLLLPRHYLALFLQTFYGSRSLVRELLRPYLKRVQFSEEQQRQFFRDREGVLFGFGVGFYILLKIPVFGVLIYGIAEASTAYLITKITDPPPPLSQRVEFAESQTTWRNKKAFLRVPLGELGSVDPHAGNVEKSISDTRQNFVGKNFS